MKKVTYPNGTTAEHTYDTSNRVERIDNRHNAIALVSSFEYIYDLNGNRTQQIEAHSGLAPETTTYTYDDADRLLSVTYPDQITTYTYDGAGNRLTETETDLDGTTVLCDKTYIYNSRNQLTDLANALDPAASVTYAYDTNGNQLSRTQGTEVTDFTFDLRDRLTAVDTSAGTLGSYTYDFQGLRVSKQSSAVGLEQYVYDDQSVLQRTSDSGRTTHYDYGHGPDRLRSVEDSQDGHAYYLFDALGSVSDLTTLAGAVLARYQWDAWGNSRGQLDTQANPFGFTGHEHDDESGLIYAKARFYDPEIGLFLSHDPVFGDPSNPPSLHRYLYAFQNPTVFVDPTGRISETVVTADFLGRSKALIIDLAARLDDDVNESVLERELDRLIARQAGRVAGAVGFAESGVRVLNVAINLVLLSEKLQNRDHGRLTDEAQAETLATLQKAFDVARFVLEDPKKAGAAAKDLGSTLVKSKLVQVARAGAGDTGAIAGVEAGATELALDVLLGLGVGTVVKRTATVGRGILEFGEELRKITDEAITAGARGGVDDLVPDFDLDEVSFGTDNVGDALRAITNDTGLQRTSAIRRALDIGRGRTAAFAEVRVAGLPDELVGFSGADERLGLVRRFTANNPNTVVAGNTTRIGLGRLDAEVKILDELRRSLNTSSSGTVRLFVDQPESKGVCDSCSTAILEFRRDFPGVNLLVSSP